MQNLAHLSDDELMAQLQNCCAEGRRLTACRLAFLIEVEDRRMYLAAASPSMNDFCIRRLGMSEGRAYRHICGARLARRYPFLLGQIERNEIFLSTLAVIGPFLDDENVHEILDATRGKKRMLVEVYLATRFNLTNKQPPTPTYSLLVDEELIALMEWARDHFSNAVPRHNLSAVTKRVFRELKTRIEKEERDALAHSLAKATQAKTETNTDANTNANTDTRKTNRTKRVPRRHRAFVAARDNGRCTYVDPKSGERCPAKAHLQTDHILGRADGGGDEVENLRLACAAHNLWYAELRYGKSYIDSRIRRSRDGGKEGEVNDISLEAPSPAKATGGLRD